MVLIIFCTGMPPHEGRNRLWASHQIVRLGSGACEIHHQLEIIGNLGPN